MEEEVQNKLFKDIADATSETLGEIGYQNTIVISADQDGKMAQFISGNYTDIAHMVTALLLYLSEKGLLAQVLDDLENFEFERDTGDN